jgi:hypothetical protein
LLGEESIKVSSKKAISLGEIALTDFFFRFLVIQI